jgi:hypothetical protein
VCFDGRGLRTATAPYGYAQTCVGTFPGGVRVVSGQTTVVDGHLALAGAIGGQITAQDSGAPLAGVDVTVFDSSGLGDFAGITDDAGRYLVTGLAAGSWTVCFGTAFTSLSYFDECYHDRTFAEGGTPITVTGGALTTADESLAPAASIAGTVTGPDGTPVGGVDITARDADGNSFYGYSGDDGTYQIRGLLAGTYTVCFNPRFAPNLPPFGYLPECYDNQPDDSTATPIDVPLSGVTGIDASLATGGAIAGTVTGPDGAPLGGVLVSASGVNSSSYADAFTNSDGTYQLPGLGADDAYYVCFEPFLVEPQPPTGYVAECYDNQPYTYPATPVAVTPGALTSGIDAQIDVGAAAAAPQGAS